MTERTACTLPGAIISLQPLWASGRRLARSCSLNPGNVSPAHGHHGVHHPLRGGAIRILQRGNQGARHDLPGKTPTVLAPAARAFAVAISGDGSLALIPVSTCADKGPLQDQLNSRSMTVRHAGSDPDFAANE
jgi:hypothetical protein